MQVLIFIIGFFGADHGLYVSVTNVTYSGNDTWEVSCRLFNTDLEDAIRDFSGESVSLRTDGDIKKSEALVASYIKAKMHFITQQGNELALKWVSGSAENDTVWSYFIVEGTSIDVVENALLVELFSDQENVVAIERDGEKRYLRFNAGVKRLQLE
ncbi:DUF6702 family protein [uncultured Imperialibacter sp.]|uniref:DUF6702 family protein n=1 Tax=uncultured Imperialibacter sp. TaxID=1672639 RepID=UPI0030DCEE8A